MNDNSGCGGFILIVIIGLAIWFWQGDPARDVRRLFGQQTLEDQISGLESFLASNRIGSSKDVWLIKASYIRDPVAVFFGYLDDWEACYEFQALYTQRYPADTYRCEYAN